MVKGGMIYSSRRSLKHLLRCAVTAALLIPVCAFALGVGKLQVRSALNQPLRAEIELLSATSDDLEKLRVTVAPQAFDGGTSFKGVEFEHTVETRSGRVFLILTSKQSLREPALNLMVQIEWANGRVFREFAVLLDPVSIDQKGPQPTAVATLIPPAASTPADLNQQETAPPRVNKTPRLRTSSAAPEPSTPTTAPATGGENYGPVARGETLWKIAKNLRPDKSISVELMMRALLEANPQAFVKRNINNLKAGALLRVPSFEEIAALSPRPLRRSPVQENQQQPAVPEDTTALAANDGEAAAEKIPDAPDDERAEVRLLPPETVQVASNTVIAPAKAARIQLQGGGVTLKMAGLADLRTRIDMLVGIDNEALTALQSQAIEEQSSEPATAAVLDEQDQAQQQALAEAFNQQTDSTTGEAVGTTDSVGSAENTAGSAETPAELIGGETATQTPMVADTSQPVTDNPSADNPSADNPSPDNPESAAEDAEIVIALADTGSVDSADVAGTAGTEVALDDAGSDNNVTATTAAGDSAEAGQGGTQQPGSAESLEVTPAATDTTPTDAVADTRTDTTHAESRESPVTVAQLDDPADAGESESATTTDNAIKPAVGTSAVVDTSQTKPVDLVDVVMGLIDNPQRALAKLGLGNDPITLGLVGLGGVLLLLLFGMLIWRPRRAQSDIDDEEDFVFDDDATQERTGGYGSQSHAGAAESKGPDMDEENDPHATTTVVIPEKLRPQTTSTNYMPRLELLFAVKNYAEAESLARQALEEDPDNIEMRGKLIEIFAEAGEQDKFLREARGLRDRIDDENNPVWRQVCVMGQRLWADNPLFRDAKTDDAVTLDMDEEELGFSSDGFEFTNDQLEGPDQTVVPLHGANNLSDDLAADNFDWEFESQETSNDNAINDNAMLDEEELFDDYDEFVSQPVAVLQEASSETEESLEDWGSLDFDFANADSGSSNDDKTEKPASVAAELSAGDGDEKSPDELGLDNVFDEEDSKFVNRMIADSDDSLAVAADDDLEVKLDLADAYLEFDDSEEARLLLEEIINKGNEGQQTRAREMMEQLTA